MLDMLPTVRPEKKERSLLSIFLAAGCLGGIIGGVFAGGIATIGLIVFLTQTDDVGGPLAIPILFVIWVALGAIAGGVFNSLFAVSRAVICHIRRRKRVERKLP